MPSLTSVMEFRDRLRARWSRSAASCAWTTSSRHGAPRSRKGWRPRSRAHQRPADSRGHRSQIWAQQFERSLGDTPLCRRILPGRLPRVNRAVLTPAELRRWSQSRLKTNPAAAEAYYEGVNYLSQSSADGQRAVDAFRRATLRSIRITPARMPGSPAASSLSASSERLRTRKPASWRWPKPTGRLRSTRTPLKLTPRGQICSFYYDWDWAGAEHWYRSARLTSTAVLPALDRSTRDSSRPRDGARMRLSQASQAAEIDPMSASAASTRAMALYYAARLSGGTPAP